MHFAGFAISIILFLLISSIAVGAEEPRTKIDDRRPKIFSKIPKTVQLYFATTRLNEGSKPEPKFGPRRHLDTGSGSLEYGTATIRTPQNMLSPNQAVTGIQYRDLIKADTDLWRLARRNFIGCFSEDDLIDKVRNWKGKICIYVHGYDKTFDLALQDASMLAGDYSQYTDENKPLLPILFSWPSAGDRSKYTEDEASVEWSQKLFDHFVERVTKEKSEDSTLDIVAHSMGNRLVYSYFAKRQSETPSRVNNLFLCSGDVDFHTVEEAREKLEAAVKGLVYIFVSDKDRPLIMSQYMHGQPRLGRPVDPPNNSGSDLATISSADKAGVVADKILSKEFWKQLTLDAAELLMAPSYTDTPDVLAWLQKNPSLDREFGEKSRLIDVSELSIANMGHAIAWPVVSSIMAGYLDFPQLHGRPVHKRPDRDYLEQCGGKPLVLYRYIRLDPN